MLHLWWLCQSHLSDFMWRFLRHATASIGPEIQQRMFYRLTLKCVPRNLPERERIGELKRTGGKLVSRRENLCVIAALEVPFQGNPCVSGYPVRKANTDRNVLAQSSISTEGFDWNVSHCLSGAKTSAHLMLGFPHDAPRTLLAGSDKTHTLHTNFQSIP